MRDPARIDRILSLVKAHWMCQPDTRLGQLVSNINVGVRVDKSLPLTDDVFYLEDDDLEVKLRELLGGKRK